MAVNVLHEFGFRTGRPCSTGVCNRLNDCLKESMILRGVFAADGVRLMIDMSGWIVWVENQSVDFRRAVSRRRRQLRATGPSLVFPLMPNLALSRREADDILALRGCLKARLVSRHRLTNGRQMRSQVRSCGGRHGY